jgi:hypothetical protein
MERSVMDLTYDTAWDKEIVNVVLDTTAALDKAWRYVKHRKDMAKQEHVLYN